MIDINFIGENSVLIKKIENIYVLYPDVKELLNRIKESQFISKLSVEPKCIFITGGTGVGKTSMIRQYTHSYPKLHDIEGTKVKVFNTSVPANATVKSMVTAMLDALGDPLSTRGTTTAQSLRLHRLCKACEVEIVIIDEFQHLIDNKTKRVVREVSDWIKMFIVETKIPVVLIGVPESVQILNDNEQLSRRFTSRYNLSAFDWHDTEGQKKFRKFLAEVDKALPFDKLSNLANLEVATPLFLASQGIVSRFMSLVKLAALRAISEKSDSITIGHLANAYDELCLDIELPNNPFKVSYETLKNWEISASYANIYGSTNNRIRAKKLKLAASEVLSKK